MSSEKSVNKSADDSNNIYEREFEDVFDLAFENAAAASTTVDKESMEASWYNMQGELQKIRKRKRRSKRWQLGGVVAASIMLGATIFSVPAGLQANTLFVEKLEKIGDDFILSFTGKEQEEENTGALTAPPPDISKPVPTEESTGLPEGTTIVKYDLERVTVSRETAMDGATFVYHDFEVPFIPDRKEYQLLIDQNNPIDPDNIYHSEEMVLEYYKDNKNLLTIEMNQRFKENDDTSFHIGINGEPEEITLEDGTAAVYYDATLSEYDHVAYRNNLVFVIVTGTIGKEDLIATANAIQASNRFELKP
ncbi:hypothetical protein [Paenibacillus sp. Marseille-Q7038]